MKIKYCSIIKCENLKRDNIKQLIIHFVSITKIKIFKFEVEIKL